MLLALVSYILLNIFLARVKAQEGKGMDEGRRKEAIDKVAKIVDTINRVVAIWFQVLLSIALIVISALFITSLVAVIGVSFEVSSVVTLELWQWGTIAEVVSEMGLPAVVSSLTLSLILLGGLLYLCIRLLIKLIRKKSSKL